MQLPAQVLIGLRTPPKDTAERQCERALVNVARDLWERRVASSENHGSNLAIIQRSMLDGRLIPYVV